MSERKPLHVLKKEKEKQTKETYLKEHFRFKQLLHYAGKYQISIQFWGEGNTNVFIAKDGVDLTDFGGFNPDEAIERTVEYLNRINKVKDEV